MTTSSFRRSLRPLLSATALVAFYPASAQYYGSARASQTVDAAQAGDDRASASRDDQAQAASTQVQAVGNSRYVGDRIEATESTRGSRGLDVQQSDGRVDPDERTDDLRGRVAIPRRATPPSEFEEFASQVVDRPLRRFGANLLVPRERGFTAPPTTTVPPDYRINPGDEIDLGLTGSVQSDPLKLVVDSDGRVFVPRVGAVRVGGIRYGDLQDVLSRAVSRQYRAFSVSATVARLHGITVYVTGFAQTPGSYTVSSLSTLVNAVLAAGGPSAGGSFRSIQLRRGGQLVSDFDLYDLLLHGDRGADAVLQNGDVITIAPVGAQVAVIGSVNSEAIFETRPGDTLTGVLGYAGGVNTVADDTRLLLLDPLDVKSGWRQIDAATAGSQPVARAEIVRVLSGVGIARPLADQPVLVTVSGEVGKPGRYYVPAGTSVAQAVAQAGGLTREAYPFGTVFTRESLRISQRASYERALADTQFMLSAEPLTSALRSNQDAVSRVTALRDIVYQLGQRKPDGRMVLNVAPAAAAVPGDVVLENNDTLYVPPRPITIGVFGSVPSPSSFRFADRRTIGEYVRMAGGVQRIGDKGQIFVVRANGTVLAPRRGMFGASVLSQPALPGDLVFVPINASRGELFAKIAALTQTLTAAALPAATVVAVSK